jgi:hypothetical protein
MKPSTFLLVSLCLSCALISLGCSKADVDKLVNQVKEQAQGVQQEAAPKVVPVGSFQWSLNGDHASPMGNASLLIVGDGRPNVFQVRSYTTMDHETFPSVMFQATTKANTYQELVGSTLTGDLYVALDSRASFWKSDAESPVSVSIRSIEETELVGQFGPGNVKNPEGKSSTASGSFRAIMAQP